MLDRNSEAPKLNQTRCCLGKLREKGRDFWPGSCGVVRGLFASGSIFSSAEGEAQVDGEVSGPGNDGEIGGHPEQSKGLENS